MSRWRVKLVALTALMAMLLEARAEDYPTHNVTIPVPFAPRGGTDVLARAVNENSAGPWFGLLLQLRPRYASRSGSDSVILDSAIRSLPSPSHERSIRLLQDQSRTFVITRTHAFRSRERVAVGLAGFQAEFHLGG